MKYVLIVGKDHLIVGPFDYDNDAISYAINVLDSDSYTVQPIEPAISVENLRLLGGKELCGGK